MDPSFPGNTKSHQTPAIAISLQAEKADRIPDSVPLNQRPITRISAIYEVPEALARLKQQPAYLEAQRQAGEQLKDQARRQAMLKREHNAIDN
jgi:hypothetical protein